MPKICYVPKKFNNGGVEMISRAEQIMTQYAQAGYDLTLRQLYYQFVSRGWIQNKDSEYKRLGGVISDARLAGMLDWDHLTDRTRNVRIPAHWGSPSDIIDAAASGYAIDKWAGQLYRVEVWVEKDALIGVVEGIARRLDVPCFSCRGYTSQSEMWGAAQRLITWARRGYKTCIIHLGDHDPSGIDMTRDIRDRLRLFMSYANVPVAVVDRVALNMDQIEQYNPPPNPAKLTDSRATDYIAQYGDDSWELDALEPQVLEAVISDQVAVYRDDAKFQARQEREDREKVVLAKCSKRWEDVEAMLTEEDSDE